MNVVSWRVGADNKLDVVGLTNTLDSTNPTDATVTVTVRNRAGAIVTGLNAVPATYVPGTTAYRLLVDDTVTPPIGQYEAEATATRAGVVGKEYATILVEKS